MSPSWMDDAACKGADANVFYAEQRGKHDPDYDPDWWNKTQAAKQICRTCPVMLECRAYAVGKPETRGVWGGWTMREREVGFESRSRRGRPPAGEVAS